MTHWQKHWSARSGLQTADPGGTSAVPQNTGKADGSTAKDKLLTTNEAADFLRLSNRTLERYRVTGGGPDYVKLGPGKRARVVYREADLVAWLNGGVFNSTSEYGA